MKSFIHHNVKSVDEAIKLLGNYKGRAKLIAGGTDLLGTLKDTILPDYPEAIVNLKTVSGLDYIREDGDGIKIGPLAKLADIASSPMIKARYGLLAEAAEVVATPQIRNMGTIGGNLCQDLRCWYYRYPHDIGGRFICHMKGGRGCYALTGENQYHSIFGASRGGCVAVNSSDITAALMALDAKIRIEGSNGFRVIPIDDFFGSVGNILSRDEIVTEIEVPKPPENATQAYLKFRSRKSIDFPIVSVASIITSSDGVYENVGIVIGGVAQRPIRAKGVEQAVKGKVINAETAEKAAELAVAGAIPLRMNSSKIRLTKALVKRSLL